jgi:uncharacterized protein (TIGR02145 family)
MEPTIYKPSIYNGAGIYKDCGTIYNGNGVYNIGYGGGGDTVDIGGHTYKTTTINGVRWLAENLILEFPGLIINPGGEPSYTAAFFPDENYRYNYGFLYNKYSVNHLINNDYLLEGWEIPSKTDFENLFSYIGGISNAPNTLRYENWGGTNEYGFSAKPGGYYYDGYTKNVGIDTRFWTSTIYSNNGFYYRMFLDGSEATINTNGSEHNAFSIRLIKK